MNKSLSCTGNQRLFRSPRSDRAAGFTMVELLVVMLIGAVLSTAVVSVFVQQTRAMALQEDLVDLEQNLRSGMDLLLRDARLAGLFVNGVFPPFTIGPIDSTGDGVYDLISEGGGAPDAIQLRLSPLPGKSITTYSGSAANLRVCTPSNLVVGQVLQLSSSAAAGYQSIQVTQLQQVSCPGDGCPGNQCDKINFSPGPSALNSPGGLNPAWTWSPGGNLWGSLETFTYYIMQNADGSGTPALMRVSILGTPMIVAFGIDDLQVVYLDQIGVATTVTADIRSVRLELAGKTRNAHNIAGSGKRSRSMSTEVHVRNLAF